MTWGGMDGQKVALHPADFWKALDYYPNAELSGFGNSWPL